MPVQAKLQTPVEVSSPRWMRNILIGAGVYNVLWGAFVVLFPAAPFRWAGMEAINYLEVWQCLGMVVGVYGIGYLIAARNPFRHWPIVLVGLLGKVLGPIGMLWAVMHHRLPAIASWTCVTNDLIWWVPFTVIVYRAVRLEISETVGPRPFRDGRI